eukprot:1599552-Rhodomonas_salina.5
MSGTDMVSLQTATRRYASLFFIIGADEEENELAILEFIHALVASFAFSMRCAVLTMFFSHQVETMDRYFESVCELDIMSQLDKAHFIVDEVILPPAAPPSSVSAAAAAAAALTGPDDRKRVHSGDEQESRARATGCARQIEAKEGVQIGIKSHNAARLNENSQHSHQTTLLSVRADPALVVSVPLRYLARYLARYPPLLHAGRSALISNSVATRGSKLNNGRRRALV